PHLRRVDAAGHVDLAVGDDLGERPEDRARRHDRRAEADAPARAPDELRDARARVLAVTGCEPRPHAVVPPRVDEAGPLDVRGLPELAEVEVGSLRDP